MKRILIVGGNGSGKTTFAKELSKITKIPLVHLDKLYWRDNWEHLTKDNFDELLIKELNKPQWILDGNAKRTLPLRLKYCDTVFVFDFSRIKCLWGVVTRTVKNYGKSRDDMGGYCPEKIDFKFYKNVWENTYELENDIYNMLSSKADINIIVFKNRKQAKKYLKNLGI